MREEVIGLDHLVLVVADVERSLAFYTGPFGAGGLGLTPERVDEWRAEQVFFPSVRVDTATVIDLVGSGEPGAPPGRGHLDHFCLVVSPATDLDRLATDDAYDVVEGPVARWGARGEGRSVYIRDPDGIVVELRAYPPTTT